MPQLQTSGREVKSKGMKTDHREEINGANLPRGNYHIQQRRLLGKVKADPNRRDLGGNVS